LTEQFSIAQFSWPATLVLLLGVSSAIVLRSLLLRRRHRRLVAEAIANGTWPSPIGNGHRGRSKAIGEKPKVYEVALGKPATDEEEKTYGAGKEKEKIREKQEDHAWTDFLVCHLSLHCTSNFIYLFHSILQPLSAAYFPTKSMESLSTPSTTSLQPRLTSNHFRSYFTRNRRTSPAPSTPAAELTPDNETTAAEPRKVTVALFIAMPSSDPSPFIRTQESSEEELPYMEFGVAELTVAGKSVEEAHEYPPTVAQDWWINVMVDF
jgi:hypothetical protein